MEQTTNYNLNLPEETDTVDIGVLNENFETIDSQMKLMEDSMTNNDTLDSIQTGVDNNNELLDTINTNVNTINTTTANTYDIVSSSTYGNSSIKSAIDTIDDNIDTINTNVSSNKSTLSTINTNVSTINTNVSTIKTNTTNTYSIVNSSTYGNSAIKSAIDGIACGYDYVSYMMDCAYKGKLFVVKISSSSSSALNMTINITAPNYTRYTSGKEWLLDCEVDYLSSSTVFYKYTKISLGQFMPTHFMVTSGVSTDDSYYANIIKDLIANNTYTYGQTPFYTLAPNTETSISVAGDTNGGGTGQTYYIALILDDPSDIDNISISRSSTNSSITVKLYKINAIYKSTGSNGYGWWYTSLKTIS